MGGEPPEPALAWPHMDSTVDLEQRASRHISTDRLVVVICCHCGTPGRGAQEGQGHPGHSCTPAPQFLRKGNWRAGTGISRQGLSEPGWKPCAGASFHQPSVLRQPHPPDGLAVLAPGLSPRQPGETSSPGPCSVPLPSDKNS